MKRALRQNQEKVRTEEDYRVVQCQAIRKYVLCLFLLAF